MCLQNELPFFEITNKTLLEESTTNTILTDTNVDLNKLRDVFKQSRLMHTNLPKDNDNDPEIFNCDYYDCDEFKALKKTLPKKQFSLLHSNIQSLKANSINLTTLLNNLNHNFDIISLTETWHTTDSNNTFIPDSLDTYYPFNGLPGTTLKSGAGFFVKKRYQLCKQI